MIYPDGSTDVVEVTVTVRDPKPAGDESGKDKGGAGNTDNKANTAKQNGGKDAKTGKGMLPTTGDSASAGIVSAVVSGLAALGAAFGLKRRRDAER